MHSILDRGELQSYRATGSMYREETGPFLQIIYHRRKQGNELIHFLSFVEKQIIKSSTLLFTWLSETQDGRPYMLKEYEDVLLNFYAWMNYIQRVGANRPCSRTKNGLPSWTSCKKQVRFQKYWLQKLIYLNQKPV